MEDLYNFIHNIIFKAVNNIPMNGKYKPYKELDFELAYTLKPLLKFFTQEQLQDYCKWSKTQKTCWVRKSFYKTMEYRGYTVQWCIFEPKYNKHGMSALIYTKYVCYHTNNKYKEVVMGKTIKSEFVMPANYTIHEFINGHLSNKEFKKELDKIIKRENEHTI
jgi:hypothetical protein